MALCRCSCPSASSICSHVAAVACVFPAFVLRVALFNTIRLSSTGSNCGGKKTSKRSNHRQIAAEFVETFLFSPSKVENKQRNKQRMEMVDEVQESVIHQRILKSFILLIETLIAAISRLTTEDDTSGCWPPTMVANGKLQYNKESSDTSDTEGLASRLIEVSERLEDERHSLEGVMCGAVMRVVERLLQIFEKLGDEFMPSVHLLRRFLLCNSASHRSDFDTHKEFSVLHKVKRFLNSQGYKTKDRKEKKSASVVGRATKRIINWLAASLEATSPIILSESNVAKVRVYRTQCKF